MDKEQGIKNIYQRLNAVMKDVEYIRKEDRRVNGQYQFVSHDAVTAKVRVALVKHGIVSVPTVMSYERKNNLTQIMLEISFVNIDDPSDKVVLHMCGEGVDNQDKGIGKAISYAVKYAYLKVLGLETGDDPERDNIDYQPSTPATHEKEPAIKPAINSEGTKHIHELIQHMDKSATMGELEDVFNKAKEYVTLHKNAGAIQRIAFAKDRNKQRLQAMSK